MALAMILPGVSPMPMGLTPGFLSSASYQAISQQGRDAEEINQGGRKGEGFTERVASLLQA